MLASGIPTQQQYAHLERSEWFAELYAHSREFQQICDARGGATELYRLKWVRDPFLQWSRRWEYVYVAQRLLAWAQDANRPLSVADAGSGFTFFPFFLKKTSGHLDIACYDNDPTVGSALTGAMDRAGAQLDFAIEDLEHINLPDDSLDAIYSVSVIEHTPNPTKVIEEMHRVLRPGGIFICTFDVDFDVRSAMRPSSVGRLVGRALELFEPPPDWTEIDFGSLEAYGDIVTTRWVAEHAKETLPWQYPHAVWLYDALRGRPRKRLYRNLTFCCGAFTKHCAD